jgi:hypothetical protein
VTDYREAQLFKALTLICWTDRYKKPLPEWIVRGLTSWLQQHHHELVDEALKDLKELTDKKQRELDATLDAAPEDT